MERSFFKKMNSVQDSMSMLTPVLTALYKEPHLRTPQDISILESYAENNEFLAKFKDNRKLRELCRIMRLISFT